MSGAPDDLARAAIEDTLARADHRPAACAALIRIAGLSLARLTSHDEASRLFAGLARSHAERAARCWRA